MKKFIVLAIVVMLMASCSEQNFLEDNVNNPSAPLCEQEPPQSSIVNSYLEQARWGSGEAYLKLAQCYHDGIGVERDFVSMLCMVEMAQQYGSVRSFGDYMQTLSPESEYKLLFDAVNHIYDKEYDRANAMAERLIEQGCADGYAVKGILAMERRDSIEVKHCLELATEIGSTFGELLLCVKDWKNSLDFDIARLVLLSNRIPLANLMLAAHYADLTNSEKNYDKMASYFYLKADESGLLGKKNAKWLLNYYKNGGIRTIDDEDYARIKKLAGED